MIPLVNKGDNFFYIFGLLIRGRVCAFGLLLFPFIKGGYFLFRRVFSQGERFSRGERL
jgi:hypothetical protein